MRNWIIATALIFVGCEQNPYHGRNGVEEPQPKGPGPKPIVKPGPTGAYSLKAEDVMNFVEGKNAEFYIRGTVPAPGTPVISVTSMPAGMTFDSSTGKLSWLPDFQAANDPANPQATTRSYIVRAEIYSTDNPAVVLGRDVVIVVQDAPQPAALNTGLEASSVENSELVHQVSFTDQEFPSGPFSVALTGFPDGVKIDWPSAAVGDFRLRWVPGYQTVVGRASGTFGGHVMIFNPRGKRLEFDVKWTVSDVVAAPRLAGPQDVSQSGDLDFILLADDLNGESGPQWSAVNPPSDGAFSVRTQPINGATGDLPRSMALVKWSKIPKNALGQPYDIELRACVHGNTCSSYVVHMKPVAAEGVRK